MFEVGFELVSSTMPNVMVLPTELPGKKIDLLQPRVSLVTFSPPWNGGIFGMYRLTGLGHCMSLITLLLLLLLL